MVCYLHRELDDIVWVGGGEEKELVSKFCLELTLLSSHRTKLAPKEENETPDTSVECICSQEWVGAK